MTPFGVMATYLPSSRSSDSSVGLITRKLRGYFNYASTHNIMNYSTHVAIIKKAEKSNIKQL